MINHHTQNPLVSVILTTYNRAGFLPDAIRSVMAQSYKNWELILWDDGSKDNTWQVVDAIGDKRIIYYYHENHGRYYTLNRALTVAKGKYFAFLDDDDQWLPEKLLKQVEIMEKHSLIDVLFTNYLNTNLKSNTTGIGFNQTAKGLSELTKSKLSESLYLIKTGLPESLYKTNFIHFDSVMIKRGLIEKIGGFDENLRNSADSVLWTALSLHGYKFAFTDDIFVLRFKPESSLSSPSVTKFQNLIKSADKRRVLLEEYDRSDLIEYLDPIYRSAYKGLIREYALKGNRMAAFSAFRQACRYGFSFRTIYLFISALLGPKIIRWVKKV